MYPSYNLQSALDDAHSMLHLDQIVRARATAINDAETYVRGVSEYCKAMSRHFAFVARNVEWVNEVSILKRKVPFENRQEYCVDIYHIPVIRGEIDIARSERLHRFIFDARNQKKATICFLDQLSFTNPRIITMDRQCVDKIRHYVNTRGDFWNDSIDNYNLRDVVNLACDTAMNSRDCDFIRFDVGAI